MNLELFDAHAIRPFAWLGLTGKFWEVSYWTVIYTWVGMAILCMLAYAARWAVRKNDGLGYIAVERIVMVFIDLCKDSFRSFKINYFIFLSSVFFFTLFACLVGLIPFMDEATKDLNTTLALAVICFMYVQVQKIKVHGVGGFLKEFIEPFALLAPVNIIGELAKICSMSFRLFGNILGGGVIYMILLEFVGSFKGYFLGYVGFTLALVALVVYGLKENTPDKLKKIVNIFVGVMFLMTWINIFFGIFEGLIQSFVLTMLTTTYLAIGTQGGDEEGEHAC